MKCNLTFFYNYFGENEIKTNYHGSLVSPAEFLGRESISMSKMNWSFLVTNMVLYEGV